ncbi:unnamed protein product [Trifolium pratense]|uniref:Uncharacterized protein n=1 Tax=Trifolium pratense TaxID=57577 RepID=A0ACB0LMH1_TRIPR|nr:unnamed protein product [Trifolium pratense]
MALNLNDSSIQYNKKKHLGEQFNYIPHDVLQNLEWCPTFSETMERSLQKDWNYLLFCDTHEKENIKFNQLGEGITQKNVSNIQINQEINIDTSLPNIHSINHEYLPKKNKKSCSTTKGKDKSLKAKCIEKNNEKFCAIKKSKDKSLKVKGIDKYSERMCSHCETKDTTQWRVGPLGRNTLCNACGLRYKSHRLMEGYKPKGSSNSDVANHSNFHKTL